MTDGRRSATARRFRDLYEDIASDLGGLAHHSQGQKQLIRRAAMLSAECERMEALSARGERELDLTAYGSAADRIGRILQRLGLSRLARDVNKDERDLGAIMGRVSEAAAQADRAHLQGMRRVSNDR